MKVAILKNRFNGEVLVFRVKGSKKSPDSIDGLKEYFGEGNREITEYSIDLGHIGSGDALIITCDTVVNVNVDGRSEDISEWFPLNEFDEPTLPECKNDRK